MIGIPSAAAQRPGPSVRWEAPDECPPEPEFRALVGDLDGWGTARVVVAQEPAGSWIARVVVDGTLRELIGDTCEELAAAAALVVAIGLREVERQDPGGAREPALAPAVTPSSISGGDAGVERSLSRAPAAPRSWSAGTGMGAEVGALPGAAPVVRASLGLGGRRLGGELEVAFSSGQTAAMQEQVAVVTRVRLLAAGTRACVGGSWARFCAGVEAGMMTAVAESPLARASGDALWIAGRAGPAVTVPLAQAWELVVQAEVGVPLVYPRFTVNRTAVHDPGGLSLRSCLGVQRRFR